MEKYDPTHRLMFRARNRTHPVVPSTLKFQIRGLTQSIATEGEGRVRAFFGQRGFCKTGLVLRQIPEQAKQRGITEDEGMNQIDDIANLSCFRLFSLRELSERGRSPLR